MPAPAFAELARALFGEPDDTSTPSALRWGDIEASLGDRAFYNLVNDQPLSLVEAVMASGKVHTLEAAETWLADYNAEHPEQLDTLDAETTLIAALLLAPAAAAGCFEELAPSDFVIKENAQLWQAIAAADGDRSKIIAALGGDELRSYAAKLMAEATPLKPEQIRQLARMVAQVASAERGEDSELHYRPEPPKPRRFPIVEFRTLKLSTRMRYLVERILPVYGLAVIWGPPKCGKSFWLFDLLMHVALGWDYRGMKVQQGPVVYLALEGAEGFKDRQLAFKKNFLADADVPVPFYTVTTRINLIAEHKTLIEDLRAQLGAKRPVCVAIDTLNRSLVGRESSDEDMTAYINACAAITDAFECCVAVVHHCGVDGVRPRGHTSLTGATDSQIRIGRDSNKNVVAEVEFMKDGPSGYQNLSRLERVDLTVDDRGTQIFSLAVVPAEFGFERGFRLNDNEKTFFAALVEAIDSFGEAPPAGLDLPASVGKVVHFKRVSELFAKKTIRFDSDDREHDRTVKSAYQRASKSLRRYQVIGFEQNYFWWTHKPVAGGGGASKSSSAQPDQPSDNSSPGDLQF